MVSRGTGDLQRKWVGVHVKNNMNQKVHTIVRGCWKVTRILYVVLFAAWNLHSNVRDVLKPMPEFSHPLKVTQVCPKHLLNGITLEGFGHDSTSRVSRSNPLCVQARVLGPDTHHVLSHAQNAHLPNLHSIIGHWLKFEVVDDFL